MADVIFDSDVAEQKIACEQAQSIWLLFSDNNGFSPVRFAEISLKSAFELIKEGDIAVVPADGGRHVYLSEAVRDDEVLRVVE